MPAKSKAQQELFGMALAVRRGELERSKAGKEVLDIVDSDMTDKEIEDFASTKHKGLKDHVKEQFNEMKNIITYINESRDTYPGQEAIDVREAGFYGYMYYDSNSGIVSTYCMNSWKELVNDFGEDEDWAKDLEKLKVGKSLDHPSGAIYCRIW